MKKILSTVLIVTSFLGFGQSYKENIYNWFDNNVGIENTNISQGVIYEEKYQPLEDRHSYFKSNQYVKGSILYKGEYFFNIKMKYDLFDQELIVLFERENKNRIAIQLFKRSIDEFYLHNTHFIKLKIDDTSGFYEEGFKSSLLRFYIRNQKTKKEIQYRGKLINVYRESNFQYIIYYNNVYNEINSRKNIVNIFPEQKQFINSFFKDNRSLRKKDYSLFLINLTSSLDNNMVKNKSLR
jgi:hypothetical protein